MYQWNHSFGNILVISSSFLIFQSLNSFALIKIESLIGFEKLNFDFFWTKLSLKMAYFLQAQYSVPLLWLVITSINSSSSIIIVNDNEHHMWGYLLIKLFPIDLILLWIAFNFCSIFSLGSLVGLFVARFESSASGIDFISFEISQILSLSPTPSMNLNSIIFYWFSLPSSLMSSSSLKKEVVVLHKNIWGEAKLINHLNYSYYYLIIGLNMAANCSATLLSISWETEEFLTKVELVLDLFSEIV